MNAPRKSLMRKRASRLAAVQALYSEALIEKKTLPTLLAAQLLESWADSKANQTADYPHDTPPEAALLNTLLDAAQFHAEAIETALDGLILPGWTKARMSLPLLACLRCFGAETLAYPDRAAAMLIDEYTQVSSQLITDEELNFAHKAFNMLIEALRR